MIDESGIPIQASSSGGVRGIGIMYMLDNICCKQCTVAHTQQGLLAIVYHTHSRAYLRGTVVHKYMPISLQLYMMSEGDLVYSLHLSLVIVYKQYIVHYRSTMVLIMIWYYHCWSSYPTYDMEVDQVDESLISIDVNIGKE